MKAAIIGSGRIGCGFAGQLLIFPRDRITPLPAPSAKVMTFVVSGGVADVSKN